MSEFYKIIEKIECISTRQYCVHGAPYCFSGFFRNLDHRRTSTPCAFHLKESHEFLRAENEHSAKRLIQILNPSSVVERRRGKQVENKEEHFEEVAKGKYAMTHVCLTMKAMDLKCFMLPFI